GSMERLGFRLTPFTRQVNRDGDGSQRLTGTANRCAMLDEGYLELLTAVSDTPLAAQLRQSAARYRGLHLVALAVGDAAAQHARLTAEGFAPQPVIHMRRPVGDPGNRAEASFRIVRVDPGTMPEGRIQCLSHETPELVWLPGSTTHPNAVDALLGVLMCVEDPAEAAARYARFTGCRSEPAGITHRLLLDRGRLDFVSPGLLPTLLPGIGPPSVPYIAAIAVRSRDLDVTRTCLRGAGVSTLLGDDERIALAPREACGATVVIHAAARHRGDLLWAPAGGG
ncbi:MAG: VOC family protein, partial [Geminicoccales bacterium]